MRLKATHFGALDHTRNYSEPAPSFWCSYYLSLLRFNRCLCFCGFFPIRGAESRDSGLKFFGRASCPSVETHKIRATLFVPIGVLPPQSKMQSLNAVQTGYRGFSSAASALLRTRCRNGGSREGGSRAKGVVAAALLGGLLVDRVWNVNQSTTAASELGPLTGPAPFARAVAHETLDTTRIFELDRNRLYMPATYPDHSYSECQTR